MSDIVRESLRRGAVAYAKEIHIGERDKEFFFRDERIDWDNVYEYTKRK